MFLAFFDVEDPVATLEIFRAIILSTSERFRALNLSIFESVMFLKKGKFVLNSEDRVRLFFGGGSDQ